MPSLALAISDLAFFSQLDAAELEVLERCCENKTARRGQFILTNGSAPANVIFLLEGGTRICRSTGQGQELTIALAGPGDHSGLVAALTSRPRNTDVIATCRTRYLEFRAQDLLQAIRRIPKLSFGLLCSVAMRLDQTSIHLFENSIYNLEKRLALRLFEMSEVVEFDDRERLLVRQRPGHQELAHMLGVSRETITRSLQKLHLAGHIEIVDNQIFVISTPDL